MTTPRLTIDLQKIEHNTRTVTALCANRGIRVAGVTKCVCGHPEVARAMLRGGAAAIADSRLENIRRMREAGVEGPFMLLRLPPLSAVEQVIDTADLSVNSELAVLAALSRSACDRQGVHDVMLMVDLGDLREGLWPAEVIPAVREALELPGIRIRGLGANLSCFAGVVPDAHNMGQLCALVEEIEQTFELSLDIISGINSSGLDLLASNAMPTHINHARIGEAILLGRETIHRRPWPGTHQDAFALHAEVLELKDKPSVPVGARGQDAFGALPTFADRGSILHALLNLGREDVDVTGIAPLDPRIRILGASSGYLALDVSALRGELRTGDELTFSLNYSALLAAMTSEYVKKSTEAYGA